MKPITAKPARSMAAAVGSGTVVTAENDPLYTDVDRAFGAYIDSTKVPVPFESDVVFSLPKSNSPSPNVLTVLAPSLPVSVATSPVPRSKPLKLSLILYHWFAINSVNVIVSVKLAPAPFADNKQMRVSENADENLPTAVILHDSFYNECLNQFIEPYFSKTFSLHYGTSTLANYIDLINNEKPDVVIVEFAERHIEYFFKLLTE